ncbi:MAG: cytochrome c oxidase subunit II [Bryobacterales bacterium]|nr:cytochrome c oxidase subunit II [Bryobacterales bacterium]MBV9401058.1 cytochrome c oxidase subunit II [Bryobacterales bacterium]
MREFSFRPNLQFFSGAPSAIARQYEWLFWALVVVCGTVTLAIAVFVVYSAIRYRRRDPDELPPQIQGSIFLELTWTVIPLGIFMGMFVWGAFLFFDLQRAPRDAQDVYVVAKQWMWKVQYLDGRREINTLHVPVGTPINLVMTSQDVIHSFFVPAFRIKQDVLPNRYTNIWFQADQPGKFHLFCAEYCGTKHSGMIGWVYAMNRQDFQTWLAEGAPEGSLASTGEKYFHQFGCANCHHFDGHGPCPDLRGLYGREVQITDGPTVIADDSYIRESILKPKAKIVLGFADIMPTFEGQISDDQLVALLAYIKALGPAPGAEQPTSSGSTPESYGIQPGIGGVGATGNANTEPGVR